MGVKIVPVIALSSRVLLCCLILRTEQRQRQAIRKRKRVTLSGIVFDIPEDDSRRKYGDATFDCTNCRYLDIPARWVEAEI